MSEPLVGIAMGSASDLPTLKPAAEVLQRFNVEYEMRVLSAHRTPGAMAEYAQAAATRGLKVLIAGAGGAAHLPGMLAANTPLPVIGVPVATTTLNGLDALLSIVQMPRGVPVATVAIGGGANAGLLAVQILASSDPALLQQVIDYKDELAATARRQDEELTQHRPS
jgi:5-(carboxyamino)imidazole ribonucleotide mutase